MMEIQLTIEGSHDLAGQIYRQLRARILDGRVAAGVRLPSSRELALQLGVSRKTTLEVYERLGAEGFLLAHVGRGTFVAAGLSMPASPAVDMALSPIRPAAIWQTLPDALAMPRPTEALQYDFRGGVSDKGLFPFGVWRRHTNYALRTLARTPSRYRDPAGDQELRMGIARYLAFSRAVPCNWQDVVVTQGAQQAIDLLARVLLQPGDVVAVEDPGYPPARACLMAHGARVVPVPVDEQGLIVERLPAQAKLIYVTPSHQFPMGMPMSLDRRLELLAWAQQHGAVILEDDYDGEYRFEGRPLESLKSLDTADLVAYVGTFSKTMFPELRVGYVVPPAALGLALLKAKQAADWHGCTLTQTALARFMLDGDFAKHLRHMHKHYTARRNVLLTTLQGDLDEYFDVIAPAAGIHLAAWLKQPLNEAALIAAARAKSVGLYGMSAYFVEAEARQGFLFGYGGINTNQIGEALEYLKVLLHQHAEL